MMKKFILSSYFLLLSFAIQALEYTIHNGLKDAVTLDFMLDRNAPYALQKQKAVISAGLSNKVGVGNTYMSKTFPIRGFVASSKGLTAQYNFTVDQLNKNAKITIKPAGATMAFDVTAR